MPPAIIAAGVGAAASIGGGLLASNSTKKAAQQATDTSLRTAEMNNALARDIYGQNKEALSGFVNRGNVAGDYYNAFLGLPSNSAGRTQVSASDGYGGGANASPMARDGFYQGDYMMPAQAGRATYAADSQNGSYIDINGAQRAPQSAMPMVGAAPATGPGGVTQADAQNAFGSFIANSDYGFQFGTGSNALNNGYAANGSLQSGAALKAMEQYRQNLQKGYRGEYLGHLGNQQGVGLSGASALAGVSQNYVGTVTANNQNAGDNAANAALMRGAANSQMWNGIAGGIGNALGSSYQWWGSGK